MTLPTSGLPTVGQPNSTEDPKVRSCLAELQSIVSAIDASNIAPNAGILDSQLASGGATGLSTFRTVYTVGGTRQQTLSASTLYLLYYNGIGLPASEITQPFFYDPANYAVTGKTQKLRIRGTIGILSTTGTFTIGLYPVSSMNASNSNFFNYGAAFTSFSVVNPTANSLTNFDSGDFTAPTTAGLYGIGITSSVTLSANNLNVSAAVLSKNV